MEKIKMEKIDELALQRSKEGRISCAVARRIAEELSVSYREVGDRAKALHLKIVACELGCF